MSRYLSALLLGAVLSTPVLVRADEHEHEKIKIKRYYDPYKHDYHEWNEKEERAYHKWVEERHEQYRHFEKARREEQREYWRWRHEHPDTLRFPER